MPNLNQIYELKQKYFQLNDTEKQVRDYIKKNKAREFVEKAFASERLEGGLLRETRSFAMLTESLNPSKPELVKYFDDNRSEEVVWAIKQSVQLNQL
jgi:hypothetical protein